MKKGLRAEYEVDLHQLPVHPRDLPSTSVNFPSRRKSSRKFPSAFQVGKRPSGNFHYGRKTLCQLPSFYHAARRPSVHFLQLSLQPETFHQISVWPQDLFSASMKCPCGRVTFCKFLLNFPAVRKRCVNFRLAWRPCVNFCQLFMRPIDFPSTSFNSLCGQNILRQLQ